MHCIAVRLPFQWTARCVLLRSAMEQCGIGDMLQFYFSATMLPRLVNRTLRSQHAGIFFNHTTQPRTTDLLLLFWFLQSLHIQCVTLKIPYMSQCIAIFCILALRLSALAMHPVSEGRRRVTLDSWSCVAQRRRLRKTSRWLRKSFNWILKKNSASRSLTGYRHLFWWWY